jgi:hypothetical protein
MNAVNFSKEKKKKEKKKCLRVYISKLWLTDRPNKVFLIDGIQKAEGRTVTNGPRLSKWWQWMQDDNKRVKHVL